MATGAAVIGTGTNRGGAGIGFTTGIGIPITGGPVVWAAGGIVGTGWSKINKDENKNGRYKSRGGQYSLSITGAGVVLVGSPMGAAVEEVV